MSQAFKVTIIVGYRDCSRPVSRDEIVDHLHDSLGIAGWPGIILGAATKVEEIEDPEPVLSQMREAAKAEGVEP